MTTNTQPEAPPLGRELEHQRARHLAQECGVIVIYGLPGIGKTWLAERFAAEWDAQISTQASLHEDLGALMEHASQNLGVDASALAERMDEGSVAWIIDGAEGLSDACASGLATFANRLEHARVVVTSRKKLALPGGGVGAIRLRGLSPRKSREIARAQARRLAWDERLVARAHELTAGRPWLAELAVDPATSWSGDPIAQAIDGLGASDQLQLAKLVVLGTSSNLGDDTRSSRLISEFFVEGAVGCYQLSREVESLLRTRDDWVFDRALELAAKAVRGGRELSGRVLAAALQAAQAASRGDLVALFRDASDAFAVGATPGEAPPSRQWLQLDRADDSPLAQLRRGRPPKSDWIAGVCAPLLGKTHIADAEASPPDPASASAAALALAARLVFADDATDPIAIRALARACGPASPEAAVLAVIAALAADDPHALERLVDELDDVPATTSEVTDLARAAAELNAGDFAVAADHLDTLVRAWQSRGEKWLAWLATGLRVWALLGAGNDVEAESLAGDLVAEADGLGWSSLEDWADALLAAREREPDSLRSVCGAPALSPLHAVPLGRLAIAGDLEVEDFERRCQNRGPSWRLTRDQLLLAVAHLAGGAVAALPIIEKLLGEVARSPATAANPELRQLATLANSALARQHGRHDQAVEILAEASPTIEHSGLVGMALSAAIRGDFDSQLSGPLLSRLGLDGAPRVLLTHRGRERLLARANAIQIAKACDFAVDIGADEIWVGDTKSRSRPMACLLLARLVHAGGAAVSPEDMFLSLRGVEYHPLDHRNTLYVTVSRVRKLLDQLLPKRVVIETVSSGWRLAADLDVCVISAPL